MALRANSTIPITQTVIIDGVEVYSQGSGHDSLNQCVPFAAMMRSQTKVNFFSEIAASSTTEEAAKAIIDEAKRVPAKCDGPGGTKDCCCSIHFKGKGNLAV